MHVARVLLLALVLVLAACGGEDEEPQSAEEPAGATTTQESVPADGACAEVEAPEAKPDGGQDPPVGALDAEMIYRLMFETNCGSFTVELDPESAPKTAPSLVSLAENGFYDDTTFHRVVPGFVIQGGDPTGTGAGGPGYSTVDPPPAATAAYTSGVVAMAKAGNEPAGTSGSQFFIVTAPDAGLPPEYAIVGIVTDGMETVRAIESLGIGDGPPTQPVVIEKVTVEETKKGSG